MTGMSSTGLGKVENKELPPFLLSSYSREPIFARVNHHFTTVNELEDRRSKMTKINFSYLHI